MASIELRGVTKMFSDGTVAVDDIDLDVADGEFVILVGPSGCGKTTALRLVAGLEEVSCGEIRIGGRVVNDVDPHDRDVAMVFQNYALYPHMTVYDNIGFPLRMQRLDKSEREQRIVLVARMLGIEDLLRRRPRELSGGQRQRVAMGRAIVRRPQAFLMDEPLSNLDAKLRVQMRAELVKLHHRLGVTTIYVTHDQTEAMTLGDRVAVLDRGVIQQVDTPQALYDRPANLFVASFIGSPAMNFIEGRLDDGGVDLGEYHLALPDHVRTNLRHRPLEVIVGLRPEEFSERGQRTPDAGALTLKGEVEIVERLGPEASVYFRVSGLPVVEVGERPIELVGALGARLNARTAAAPGKRIELVVDPGGIHLFDRATGQSLIDRPLQASGD